MKKISAAILAELPLCTGCTNSNSDSKENNSTDSSTSNPVNFFGKLGAKQQRFNEYFSRRANSDRPFGK